MKKKILIASALLVSVSFLHSCNNSSNNKEKNEMDSSMNHEDMPMDGKGK